MTGGAVDGWWRRLWQRSAPLHGVAFFVTGFGWDAVTLDRIDKLLDNAILAVYLVALAALLVVQRRVALHPTGWPRLAANTRRLGFAEQFLFGGLYSGYVIFYSKSVTIGRGLVFVGVLTALMMANEFLGDRLRGRRLRTALFTLCAFSFLLFFIPVVTGWLGRGVVVVAGILAALLSAAVVALGDGERHAAAAAVRLQAPVIGGVLALLAVLEVLHLIPPVPLALMDGGIYHHVERVDGGYQVRWEDGPWWDFAQDDRRFRQGQGDAAWCFTAVFAPNDAQVEVLHRWERHTSEGWVVTDDIPFTVQGGRGGGYRGYTRKRNLSAGDRWRVRVLTGGGRELGRYPFGITQTDLGYAEREWRHRSIR